MENYIIPKLGRLRVSEIGRADIAAFHRGRSHTPRTANYCLAVISKTMAWAEEMGYRPLQSNPCYGYKKYKENKRKRYLTPVELARLGNALTKCELEGLASPSAVATIRLLVFTGARQSEILSLKWECGF